METEVETFNFVGGLEIEVHSARCHDRRRTRVTIPSWSKKDPETR